MGLATSAYLHPIRPQRFGRLKSEVDGVGPNGAWIVGQHGLEVVERDGRHVGTAQQRIDPCGALVRIEPQPYPATETLLRVGEVEVPAFVPQRLVGRRVRALVPGRRRERLGGNRFGQDGQRIGVEHMLTVPLQHHHEHLVAAVGLCDEHRRDNRHHHPEEALSAHAVTDVVQADRRVWSEGVVVGPQQRLVVIAAQLVGQRAAEEIRDIGHRRTPRDGLPVHHCQRPVGAGLAEQHVVQPVVTVHKTVRALRRDFACDVGVEASDQALAHLAMLRRDLVAVALEEPGVQLADQGLVQRRLAVEPFGVRHRGVAEQRSVHPTQFCQRQRGLFDCRAADFVADDGRARIAKQ